MHETLVFTLLRTTRNNKSRLLLNNVTPDFKSWLRHYALILQSDNDIMLDPLFSFQKPFLSSVKKKKKIGNGNKMGWIMGCSLRHNSFTFLESSEHSQADEAHIHHFPNGA